MSKQTSRLLSGIVASQNQAPQPNDFIGLTNNNWVCQQFYFPDNYIRGEVGDEQIIPEFSGFQILVGITEGLKDAAGLDWRIDRYLFGTGWVTENQGMVTGNHIDGDRVWLDVFFDSGLQPTETSLVDKWRFCIRGRSAVVDPSYRVQVPYDGVVAIIDEHEEYVKLTPGTPYSFELDSVPSLLILDPDDELVYYSVQQGVEKVWFSNPNPLATDFVSATDNIDVPLTDGGNEISFLFRLLALVADEGQDFLGNAYRSVIKTNSFDSIASTFGDEATSYWLSKPNPSRFAVENLYFDVRDSDDNAQVIDQALVDPITPGVYFHIYYTNEDASQADTNKDWDERLWQHIPKTFKMDKLETHILPEPVSAKYIKVEFSHLQPKPYSPGEFQQPISYKKHPKWVLDYFLIRTEFDQLTSRGDQFVPRQVGIIYNALDLAYNYYLDDLAQEPDSPVIIDPSQRQQYASMIQQTSTGIDSETLSSISLDFKPFQQHPAYSTIKYLLSESIAGSLDNYPTELPDLAQQSYDVSALRSTHKDDVIYEATHPVMFFFVACRHKYKEVQAKLTYNRAYFVGVRQISFSRERYTIENDTNFYIETMGDDVNMARNDFTRVSEGVYSV